MRPELHVYSDAQALAGAAAREIASSIAAGLGRQGTFTLVLAGGNTPRRTYEILAASASRVAWDRVHVFWGDERCVPPQHAESNFGSAKAALLDAVRLPAENVHRIRGELSAEAAADACEVDLRTFFGLVEPTSFDLVLLGMGEDGHTASLFPGAPALSVTTRWACAVANAPKPPKDRVTLTLPALRAARDVMFLVAGAGKRRVLSTILSDPDAAAPRYPAAAVRPRRRLLWFADSEAAPA